MYGIVESVCWTPEINITRYANYTAIKILRGIRYVIEQMAIKLQMDCY